LNKPLFYFAISLFAVSGLGIMKLSVNDDFIKFFPEENRFRTETERISKLLFSPHHVEVVVSAEPPATLMTKSAFKALIDVESSIRKMPQVASVHGLATVLNPIREIISNKGSLSALTSDELHQLFLIYELSLPQGQGSTEILSADHRATRMSVLLKPLTTREIQETKHAIEALLSKKTSKLSILVTGESIPVAYLTSININSMVVGIVGSVLGIGLTFCFFQRIRGMNWVLVLSVATPLVAGFGLWGWAFREIGVAAVAIISLTLGIIVDDTAHVIGESHDVSAQWSPEGRRSMIAKALDATIPGVVSTSLVLIVAMGLLTFSGFEVNRTFGIVSSVIIVLALLFTLLVLPRLIYLAAPGSHPWTGTNDTRTTPS
jgi:predicted RND superfamily exporter protein